MRRFGTRGALQLIHSFFFFCHLYMHIIIISSNIHIVKSERKMKIFQKYPKIPQHPPPPITNHTTLNIHNRILTKFKPTSLRRFPSLEDRTDEETSSTTDEIIMLKSYEKSFRDRYGNVLYVIFPIIPYPKLIFRPKKDICLRHKALVQFQGNHAKTFLKTPIVKRIRSPCLMSYTNVGLVWYLGESI